MCSKGDSDSVSEFGGEWSDGRGQWDPQVISIFVFVYISVFVFVYVFVSRKVIVTRKISATSYFYLYLYLYLRMVGVTRKLSASL